MTCDEPEATTDPVDPDDVDTALSPSLDAEAVLLCALLWGAGEDVTHTTAHLRAGDFQHSVYAELYEVVVELHTAGEPHHAARVHSALADAGRLDGHAGRQLVTALQTVATLGTPTLGIRAMAADVLRAAYRRRFTAAVAVQERAARDAPTNALFELMCEQGRVMRAETARLTAFTA